MRYILFGKVTATRLFKWYSRWVFGALLSTLAPRCIQNIDISWVGSESLNRVQVDKGQVVLCRMFSRVVDRLTQMRANKLQSCMNSLHIWTWYHLFLDKPLVAICATAHRPTFDHTGTPLICIACLSRLSHVLNVIVHSWVICCCESLAIALTPLTTWFIVVGYLVWDKLGQAMGLI